jgi:Ras-related GTP-binding protein A/B
VDVEQSQVPFLGNLALNLWDCGGQEEFMEKYFTSQRDHIFTNVEVLIFVFDVESNEIAKDMLYFRSCVEAIQQNSRDAKIFALIHKMDLIPENKRDKVYQQRASDVAQAAIPLKARCFPTSIWDETLYKAWSDMVYALIPNIQKIQERLRSFCDILQASEVVLFERATFLVISHSSSIQHRDTHRFEKISNIIKQFKLSCSKNGPLFTSMEIRNSLFTCFIEQFTTNTCVMVIMPGENVHTTAALININQARPHFERYLATAAG